jgi:hypothetical protein
MTRRTGSRRAIAAAAGVVVALAACSDDSRGAPGDTATVSGTAPQSTATIAPLPPADSPAASASPTASNSGAPTPSAGPRSGPAALIGSWTVEQAAEEPGVVLTFQVDQLQLTRTCGTLVGSWRAAESLFLAEVSGTSGSCATAKDVTPRWLGAATAWRVDDLGPVLANAAGDALVRLTPTAAPPRLLPGRPADESFAKPAPLPLRRPTRRPAGSSSAGGSRCSPARLPLATGPTSRSRQTASGPARTAATDRAGGGPPRRGTLLATSGPRTLIGCDSLDVPGWLAGAIRAGFRGSTLILYDARGKETGRLRRTKA